MNCSRVTKELSLYIDGRLSKSREADVSAHLEHCTCCSRELERMSALKSSLSSLPKAAVSPEFKVSFLRALDSQWRKVIRRPDFFEQFIWNFRFAFSFQRMARVAVPVFSLFFVIAFWSMAPKDSGRHISIIRGNAYVSSISFAHWQSGDSLQSVPLSVGGKTGYNALVTADSKAVTANIADKIILRLDRGTKAYVSRPTKDGKFTISLEKGQIYARTTKSFKGSGLSVVTPFSRTSVTGTEFVVQAWPGGSETRVIDGSVKVENLPLADAAQVRAVIVREGEKSEVLEGRQPSLASPMILAERRAVRRFVGKDAGKRTSKPGVSVDSRRNSSASSKSIVPGLF